MQDSELTKFDLIICTRIEEPDNVRHHFIDFTFGGETKTLEVTENEVLAIENAFNLLWGKNRISQGLQPGGRVFGLFEKAAEKEYFGFEEESDK